jgi:glucan phosphoethanolaminetransferase (alkaline phosphatase superfamily)
VFNSAYNAIKFPDDYRFKGDTLGVDVSLAWVGPAFWLVLAALSILWVVRDRKNPQRDWTPSWNRTNTILLSLVILLLPIQFFLLRFGTPTDDIRDPLGVILTMFQWLLLNLAFVPWQLPTTITETSRSTEQSPAGH